MLFYCYFSIMFMEASETGMAIFDRISVVLNQNSLSVVLWKLLGSPLS